MMKTEITIKDDEKNSTLISHSEDFLQVRQGYRVIILSDREAQELRDFLNQLDLGGERKV